jgi:hypothetical protein
MTNIRTCLGTCSWSSSFIFHILAFCFLVIPVNTVFPSSRLTNWLLSRYFPIEILYAFLCHFTLLPFSLLPYSFEQRKGRMWSFLCNILHFHIVFFLGPNTFLNILFCTLCSSFKIRNPISKPWIYKVCSIQELVCLSVFLGCVFLLWAGKMLYCGCPFLPHVL